MQARKWYNCLDYLRGEYDQVNWGWMKEENNFLSVWVSLLELSNVTKAFIHSVNAERMDVPGCAVAIRNVRQDLT